MLNIHVRAPSMISGHGETYIKDNFSAVENMLSISRVEERRKGKRVFFQATEN